MSHNIQKTITIDGPVADLAFIYRWAQNIVDCLVSIEGHATIHHDLSALVNLLRGDATQLVDIHGWSDIDEVDFDGNQLYIVVVTPYGNLRDMMTWLRKRFSMCDFKCWIDVNGETIENETD